MRKHISALLSLMLLILVVAGCSFTTANMSDLRFGKNNKAEPTATTFSTDEDIYVVTEVANAPEGKYKLEWKVTYDNVAGKPAGSEVGTKVMEFEGSKQLWQSFSSPLPGTYKVEATLLGDDGKKIDSKTGTVTVKADS